MSKTARISRKRHGSSKILRGRGKMTRSEKIEDIPRFISTHTL
jgi:hypothetical protein